MRVLNLTRLKEEKATGGSYRKVFLNAAAPNLKPDSILRKKFKGWADINTMRKLFSSCKIALNLTLNDYGKYKKGINARCFEIPACNGALQLSAYNKNIEEFFSTEEIAYFKNPSELISKIKYFLENEKTRKNIVSKAYEKNKGNSYANKAQEMLRYLKNDKLSKMDK